MANKLQRSFAKGIKLGDTHIVGSALRAIFRDFSCFPFPDDIAFNAEIQQIIFFANTQDNVMNAYGCGDRTYIIINIHYASPNAQIPNPPKKRSIKFEFTDVRSDMLQVIQTKKYTSEWIPVE